MTAKTKLELWLDESDENRRLHHEEGLILEVTEQIWEALEKKDWSLTQLAEKLGVGLSRVSKLLNGTSNMTLRTLADIMYVLGIPVEGSFHLNDADQQAKGDECYIEFDLKAQEIIEWEDSFVDAYTALFIDALDDADLAANISETNWSRPKELKVA